MKAFTTTEIVSASKWSTLAQVSVRAMTPLIFVIVSRLLTPSDYGVFAMAGLLGGDAAGGRVYQTGVERLFLH
jgi:hypothetical protein